MLRLARAPIAVWQFYRDGFRQMTWGRTLWLLIIAKLLVLFVVLRVFFFRPALAGLSEAEKQAAVAEQLGGAAGDAGGPPGGESSAY